MHCALGDFNLAQGDLEGAEEEYQAALKIDPFYIPARRAGASLLLREQRYAAAQEHLGVLLEVDRAAFENLFTQLSEVEQADLVWLRGAVHLQAQELEQAEPLMRRALELEPHRSDWVRGYAALLIRLNKKLEGIKQLSAALSQNSNDAALHRDYARLMAEEGLYDQAERHLKAALKIDPLNVETLTLRDELQPTLERYRQAFAFTRLAEEESHAEHSNEAAELYAQAFKVDPNHLPALKSYAAFLEHQGRYTEAVRVWVTVRQRAAEEAKKHLEQILYDQGDNSEILNGLALVLINLGQLEEAEGYLRRSLAHTPDKLETLQLLVDVLEKTNRPDEARLVLAAHLSTVSADARLCLTYARLLKARGDYKEAKKYYMHAMSLAPNDPEVSKEWQRVKERFDRWLRASLKMAVGVEEMRKQNFAEAETQFRQALEEDAEHIPTLKLYAEMLESQGKVMEANGYMILIGKVAPDTALAHYRDQIPARTISAEMYSAYGQLLASLGQTEEALEQFKLALNERPAYLPALTPAIRLTTQSEQLCEAESLLHRALEQPDPTAQVYWLYGTVLTRRHRFEQAKKPLARAVELMPENPRYRETLDSLADKFAQVLQARLDWVRAIDLLKVENPDADPAEAERLFVSAYSKCGEYVPNLVDYGEFLLKQGRKEEGRAYLRRALVLDPCEGRATQLLSQIESET
jgi:tetratricopeptide (TPR) repeat protein